MAVSPASIFASICARAEALFEAEVVLVVLLPLAEVVVLLPLGDDVELDGVEVVVEEEEELPQALAPRAMPARATVTAMRRHVAVVVIGNYLLVVRTCRRGNLSGNLTPILSHVSGTRGALPSTS